MPLENRLQVLCASLARRKDRRFVLEHSLELPGKAALGFFEAIDDSCLPAWRLARFPEGTSRTDYAARLTLRLALRRFLQGNSRHLLFLEDTVVQLGKWHLPQPKNYDLCFLGGSEAIVFSREGARKALPILREWNHSSWARELTIAIDDDRLSAQKPEEPITTRRADYHKTSPGLPSPYMQVDDLAVLDAALNSATRVLEYGCGGSTFHIATRLKGRGELLSIEHNRTWFDTMSALLKGRGLPAKILLREPRPQRDHDGPWRFQPGQLTDYISAPLEYYAEKSVDLVLIDGRERMRCVAIAKQLLKKNGILMIHDFWPRHRYRSHLTNLLVDFDYLFESPPKPGNREQGMAVFRLR